jgi:hypothetical protein
MSAPIGPYRVDRDQPPLSAEETAAVREFHELYFRRWLKGADTLNCSWLGHQTWKCPLDLWIYQELLVTRSTCMTKFVPTVRSFNPATTSSWKTPP